MSENNSNTERKRVTHRSIVFPVLLILVGLFLLFSNLNLIPGDAKSILIRFWPLIFVLGGLEDLINHKWVGAVLNVGIGGILLLASMGYFPWTAWEMIWKIWPVFIVALGLEIVFRGQSLAGSLIGILISVLVVGALLWFALNSSLRGQGATYPIDYEVQGAESAHIQLNSSIGNLNLAGLSQKQQLISGDVMLAKDEKLLEKYEVQEGVGKLTLESDGMVIFPFRSNGTGLLWDLKINNNLPVQLVIEQGIGQQRINLAGINLDSFEIQLGIGSMEIVLPEEDVFKGKIECDIGELVVILPKDLPVKFRLDTGITSKDYPIDFVVDGDWLYSPGGKDNNQTRTLEISNPIGVTRIKYQ